MTAADQVGLDTSTPATPELDPISPELAMVDPALAAAAREALPPPGEFRPRRVPDRVVRERPAPPVEVRVEPLPEPPAPRRRGRRAAELIVLAAAAVGVFVLGYAVADRSSSSDAELAARTDALPQTATHTPSTDSHGPLRRPAASAPPTRAPAPPTTTAPASHATSPKQTHAPATTAARRPATSTHATKPSPSPPQHRTSTAAKHATTATKPAQTVTNPEPPAQSGFVPARTWTWAPVAGATTYRVTFIRGSSPFYRATTRVPRLELPARIKFAPGKYTWTVVPVVNAQPRAEVVHSSFTVG